METKGCILITGANGGLGSAIVSRILKDPILASRYVGLYAVRKAAAASRLWSCLRHAPATHGYDVLQADLSSLASIRAMASGVNGRIATGALPPIRALILCAGYQDFDNLVGGFFHGAMHRVLDQPACADDEQRRLRDDLASQFSGKHGTLSLVSTELGPTKLSCPHNWKLDTRVNKRNGLSGQSIYHDSQWKNLFPGPEQLAQGKWSTPADDASWKSGARRYGASKLCAIMLMHELSNRVARDPLLSDISVLGLDPGGMPSDICRRGSFMTRYILMKVVMPLVAPAMVRISPNGPVRTLWKSACDVLRACFDLKPPAARALYLNGSDEQHTCPDSHDELKRQALWRYGINAGNIRAGDTILEDWE